MSSAELEKEAPRSHPSTRILVKPHGQRPRDSDDGSLIQQLRWRLRQFKNEHLFLFEAAHLTKVAANITIILCVGILGSILLGVIFVPQPFTAWVIYGGCATTIVVLLAYGYTVGRYYG